MCGVLRLSENRKQGRKQTPRFDEQTVSRNGKRDGTFCGKAKAISR